MNSHEQEVARLQDDYLALLREEQDAQFNADIEEHKEILQKIYDDKLRQRSEEIEAHLQVALREEISQKVEKDIRDEYEDKLIAARQEQEALKKSMSIEHFNPVSVDSSIKRGRMHEDSEIEPLDLIVRKPTMSPLKSRLNFLLY